MPFDPQKYHRHSIRLRDYNYSNSGAYFITICTKNRECLFGEIENEIMQLNEFGEIIREKWEWLGKQYPYVELDEFVVMPNHLHGIFWITNCGGGAYRADDTIVIGRGGSRPAPTKPNEMKIKPIGQIIGAFKTVTAKQINSLRQTQGLSVWQRDFYDHIGRNENELNRIRLYIRGNPENWDFDNENPVNKSPKYVAMLNPQRH